MPLPRRSRYGIEIALFKFGVERPGERTEPLGISHAPGSQVGEEINLRRAQVRIECAVVREAVGHAFGLDDSADGAVVVEQLSPSTDKAEIGPDYCHLAHRYDAKPFVRHNRELLAENRRAGLAFSATRLP